jgi:hypothetical protein
MPIQAFEDLQKYGFNFEQISYIPSYKNQYIDGKLDYPEEFQITPVDERVDIYDGYDDSLYQIFIDKAKEIFKKYNEDGKCNPDNKNLKMLNSECDKNFDEYTYGGYECGDDGKWSKNCKPFYCHENYYFDYVNQKCIKDTIAEKYSVYFSEEETTKEKKIKELENEIKELENEIKESENEIKELKNEIEKLEIKKKEYEDKIIELENEINELNEKKKDGGVYKSLFIFLLIIIILIALFVLFYFIKTKFKFNIFKQINNNVIEKINI